MMRIGLRTLHPFKFSGTLFQDVDDKSAYMGDMKGCKPRISAAFWTLTAARTLVWTLQTYIQ